VARAVFPTSWSSRLWARTWCAKDATGRFACATGNCRTGTLEGSGPDDATPATLAEFTLDSGGHNDLYDMSLVDGYSLPILVEPAESSGKTGMTCAATGCSADLNLRQHRHAPSTSSWPPTLPTLPIWIPSIPESATLPTPSWSRCSGIGSSRSLSVSLLLKTGFRFAADDTRIEGVGQWMC
jgi:hypothetical protein